MKLTHIKRISTTTRMKYHRNYCEAKNGNLIAAQKLVSDIIPDPMIFKNLTGYVCPVIKPKGNRIPLALAEYMAFHSKLILEDAITFSIRHMAQRCAKGFIIIPRIRGR